MPTVGDVNVNIKGNADSLTKAGRDASAALKSLQRDIQLIQADYKAGRLSQVDFAASMAEVRRQAVALGGQLGNVDNAGIGAFNRVMQQTAPAVTKVGLSINSLRGPLATLASQAIGANGAVGTLGSMLLQLSSGAGPAIAAIAVIGGLVAVMKKLGEDTAETKRKYEEFMDSLRKQTPLAIVGAQLDEATAKYQTLLKASKEIDRFGEARASASDVAKAKAELDQLTATYNGFKKALGEGHESAVKKFADEAAEAFKRMREEAQKTADAVAYANRIAEVGLLGGQRPQGAFKPGPANIPLINQGAFALNDMGNPIDNSTPTVLAGSRTKMAKGMADEFTAPLKAALRNLARASEVLELGTKIGDTIGSAMSRGIGSALFDSSKQLGATLKAIFRSIFEEILKEIIKMFAIKLGLQIAGALIPGAGFAKVFGGGGASVASSLPASNIQINVPPAQSPLTAARDAQWLGVLSESLRGLQSLNGVRLAPVGAR